jgi:hypothetical protein
MSIVTQHRRPINPETAAEIVRVGHIGDAPAEPVPLRYGDVLTPEELEEYADRMEIDYAARTGRNDAPSYAAGVMLSRYRSLHRIYLETLERLEASRHEFWPDPAPELPPAAYYDPGDDDDLVGATVDSTADGYNS